MAGDKLERLNSTLGGIENELLRRKADALQTALSVALGDDADEADDDEAGLDDEDDDEGDDAPQDEDDLAGVDGDDE
jgi:hypothetical protein